MKRNKGKKASGGTSFANLDLGQIEQLLGFMSEHNLEEFEYAKADLRIRLKKPGSNSIPSAPRLAEIIVPGAVAAPEGESGSTGSDPDLRGREDLHLVKSPIVGTFYHAASPGAEPFVKIGMHVDAGQTLCIVEAMKLMNEIESDVNGEVLRIFAENGQPVEYGQPLFGIRPTRQR